MSERWEYASILVDTWLPVGVQAGVKEQLEELGALGWEAYAVTPPTPPLGENPNMPDSYDPDQSTYEILLKRRVP